MGPARLMAGARDMDGIRRFCQCPEPEVRMIARQAENSGELPNRDTSAPAQNCRGRGMQPTMIAVIFEVWPASGRKEDYLAIAATLRAELEQIDGFVSVERFQSLTDAGKLLSLSFWRDEEAVTRWRNQAQHRASQAKGRGGVFADYRLRIASVVRDYGMTDRAQAPADSRAAHKA